MILDASTTVVVKLGKDPAEKVSLPFVVHENDNVSPDTLADHAALAPCLNEGNEPLLNEDTPFVVHAEYVKVAADPPENPLM